VTQCCLHWSLASTQQDTHMANCHLLSGWCQHMLQWRPASQQLTEANQT
jgi:hypothetical protein